MKTLNFQKLIQAITKREFIIDTNDNNLEVQKEYYIYKVLPLSNRKIGFKWVAPKNEENFLRSFINTFTSKYFEPNPEAYNITYGGLKYLWDNKTEREKEFAYLNHKSNMYSKNELLQQIEFNCNDKNIETTLLKYGFYSTNYGIGIFCYWQTNSVLNTIEKMSNFLKSKNIPFKNEFSDAKWVLRFKINLTKENHEQILKSFTN